MAKYFETEYLELLYDLANSETERGNRTGISTRSIFGHQAHIDLSQGFPALTTKRLAFKSVVSELLWFISGSTDERNLAEILYNKPREQLQDKTTIWTANANEQGKALGYHNSSHFKLLGPIYGSNWVNWVNMESTEIIKYPEIKKERLEIPFTVFHDEECYLADDIATVEELFDNSYYVRDVYRLWISLIARSNASFVESWHNFNNFLYDIEKLPNFYKWLKNPNGYFLSSEYFNTNELGPKSAIFIPNYFQYKTPSGHKKIVYNQLDNLISDIKNNPSSRRLVLSAWNVGEISSMALPPCHNFVQFYVNEGKLSAMFNMRSNDIFLGLPFNVASYALMVHMIAHITNLEVGNLVQTTGDMHLYSNHVDQARIQYSREPYAPPELLINRTVNSIYDFTIDDFQLLNYQHHAPIKADMAV